MSLLVVLTLSKDSRPQAGWDNSGLLPALSELMG